MRRDNGNIKEFANGNLNIKYTPEDIEQSKKDTMLVLAEILSSLDCYFVGDDFSLGNYAMGHMVYNAHSDFMYLFAWNHIDNLMHGKTVKLYASRPDKDDRELLWKEFQDEPEILELMI